MLQHWTSRTHQTDTFGTEWIGDRFSASFVKLLFETTDGHPVQFHQGR